MNSGNGVPDITVAGYLELPDIVVDPFDIDLWEVEVVVQPFDAESWAGPKIN